MDFPRFNDGRCVKRGDEFYIDGFGPEKCKYIDYDALGVFIVTENGGYLYADHYVLTHEPIAPQGNS